MIALQDDYTKLYTKSEEKKIVLSDLKINFDSLHEKYEKLRADRQTIKKTKEE